MYINGFWIFIIIVVAVLAYLSHKMTEKKMREAYLEQREISEMYLDIARINIKPKIFAQHLIYRLVHHSEISNENVYSILIGWGVSREVAKILSYPNDDDKLKYKAEILAKKQVSAFVSDDLYDE